MFAGIDTFVLKSILTLMTVGYLLIHWNIFAIWLMFHCSIAITMDFAQENKWTYPREPCILI